MVTNIGDIGRDAEMQIVSCWCDCDREQCQGCQESCRNIYSLLGWESHRRKGSNMVILKVPCPSIRDHRGVSVQTIVKYRIRSHTRHNGHVSVGYVLARLERHLDLKIYVIKSSIMEGLHEINHNLVLNPSLLY